MARSDGADMSEVALDALLLSVTEVLEALAHINRQAMLAGAEWRIELLRDGRIARVLMGELDPDGIMLEPTVRGERN